MNKIIKIGLIFILAISLLTSTVSAYPGYNVGPREYTLSNEYCIVSENANVTDSGVFFSTAGYVTYDFYLIFNAASMDIAYSASADTELSINCGNTSYEAELPAAENEVYTLTFTDSDGNAYSEPKGERNFTISVNSPIEIHSIAFEKEMIETDSGYDDFFLCDLTADEQAIETAVIVDQRASILLVNGARRYINVQNAEELPITYNGRIYLPVHTLARALGYYYEDAPDKMYTLMRHDEFEYSFTPTESFKEVLGGEKISVSDPRIYMNGITYLPLRMFAEATGKTVGYKDGIAVIDDKFTVKDVLNENLGYLDGLFSPFRESEPISSQVYHVAQTEMAADDNPGTEEAPFKTLAQACAVADAGDTVIVHEGVYNETLEPQHNGSPTAPIVFKAAEGERVVLSAAQEISGFTLYKDNIYMAPISWDLGDGRNQIFYQNDSMEYESMIEARYPNVSSVGLSNAGTNRALLLSDENEPYSPLWPVAGDFSVTPTETPEESLIVTSDTLLNQEEENYWQGAYFVSMHGNGYGLHNAKVESSSKGQLTVTDKSKWFWPIATDSDIWSYGYLAGHMNALDAYGEWIVQDGTLYLIPPEGTDIDNLKIFAKQDQIVADISNSKYVQLKGFETLGGSIKMNNSEMCVLYGLSMSYLNHYIIGDDQHSGFIDDADAQVETGAPSRGEVGIYVGGRDNVIINNNMQYAAAAAIYGVGRNIYIENNTIKECGYAGSYVAGLYFTTEPWKANNTPRGGHSIYGNTVYRAGRSVLQFTRAAGKQILPHMPSEIAFNDFHDGTLTSLDTGITYAYYVLMGHEKLFTNYHHNYVYYTLDQQHPYQMGIYHDGGTENVNVYNNIVFTTNENTWYGHYAVKDKFKEESIANHSIFSANAENSYAHCPKWNNSIIGTVAGGPEALTTEQFPNGKQFYAGAGQNSSENRLNCNTYFDN